MKQWHGVLMLCACVAIAFPAASDGQTWKGEKKNQKDGIHILNPAEPMFPLKEMAAKEAWRIGDNEEPRDEELFGFISDITVDFDGNVYLCDSQRSRVTVFGSDGTLVRRIGNEGEGPGEFRHPASLFLLSYQTLGTQQAQPNRIELFNLVGMPQGTLTLRGEAYEDFFMLYRASSYEDTVIIHGQVPRFTPSIVTNVHFLDAIDGSGERIARLYDFEQEMSKAGQDVLDLMVMPLRVTQWTVGQNGRVYVADPIDYRISSMQLNGEHRQTIARKYPVRKRGSKELHRLTQLYESEQVSIPLYPVRISKTDRAIEKCFVHGDGRLWVLTSRGIYDRPKGSMGIFDEFDGDGRFVRQVSLLGEGDPEQDAYYLIDGRLYIVVGVQAVMTRGISEQVSDSRDIFPMSILCYDLE